MIEAEGDPRTLRVSFLDTFDWRLYGLGGRLVCDSDDQRILLRWLPPAAATESPVTVPVPAPPTTADELPAGFLADRLGAVIAPRALLVVGELAGERRRFRIVDSNGDILLALVVDTVRPLNVDGRGAGPPWALVEPTVMTGGERVGALLAAAIDEHPVDRLALAAMARGRQPGDYSSKLRLELNPDDRADHAVRAILGVLVATVEANVDGTRRDLDPEFLHDLRVAVRRARSALSQLKEVLSAADSDELAAGLKWVGGFTGPLRDLDVALIDLDGHRLLLPAARRGHLDPVEGHLRQARGRARGVAVRALDSHRFAALLASWHAVVDGGTSAEQPPRHAADPIVVVAGDRIHRAWQRIVKRGRALGDAPPAAALHQLRIDAKKLRYLLEFFRGLFPSEQVEQAIAGQKKLQDLLGSFNDLTVQRRRLLDDARMLLASADPSADTMLAIGRLDALLEAQQGRLRAKFRRRFEAFAGHDLPAALGMPERGRTA